MKFRDLHGEEIVLGCYLNQAQGVSDHSMNVAHHHCDSDTPSYIVLVFKRVTDRQISADKTSELKTFATFVYS